MTTNQSLVEIKLLQKSRLVELVFSNAKTFQLSCEYLRVYSPSAEVRGHGGDHQYPTGKENVNIIGIEPVGNYALKFIFDDGHDTGLYTWDYLYDLGIHRDPYWEKYKKNTK